MRCPTGRPSGFGAREASGGGSGDRCFGFRGTSKRGAMGRLSRDKGNRAELEVAAIFREHGFDCDRVPNSGGLRIKGDLYGSVPVHVEVKRQEVLRLRLWLRQAAGESDGKV